MQERYMHTQQEDNILSPPPPAAAAAMSNEVDVSTLPRDVIFNILSRLPTKSLLHFRCVSKSSHPLTSHPHFVKLHLSRSETTATSGGSSNNLLLLHYQSIDYAKELYSIQNGAAFTESTKLQIPFKSVHGYLRIVGSSKGLVCLFDTNYFSYLGTIIFWNPIIRKYKIVSNSHSPRRYPTTFSHMIIGFGFDSKINDFKVVKILYHSGQDDSDPDPKPEVFIYTMQYNSWRKIKSIAPCFVPKIWSNNVLVKEAVNWLAHKNPKTKGGYDSIMAFDLTNEVFRAMDLPINGELLNRDQMCLRSYEESLSLLFWHRGGVEAWVMKEYGVTKSWTKKFSIILEAEIQLPLCFMNNGDVLIVIDDGKVVLYEAEKEQIKYLEICGVPSSFRLVGHMSSLALLDSGHNVGLKF